MPTVPVYNLPTVSQSADPSSSFSAPDMPDVAGKQMQIEGQARLNAGAALIKVADVMDDAATQAADNEFQQSIQKILRDPNEGYLSRTMKDAQDSRGDYQKALDKARTEASGALANETQRAMFERVSAKRMMMASDVMDSHQMAQLKQWDVKEKTAAVGNAIDNAMASYGSWRANGADGSPAGQFAIYKADIISKVDALAKAQGVPLDSDVAKSARLGATTALHEGVINSMITMPGQSKNANDYFQAHIDEIDPQKRAGLNHLIKSSTDVDSEASAYRALQKMGGGYQAQMKAIQSAFDSGGKIGDVTVDGKLFFQLKQLVEQDKSRAQADGERYVSSVLGKAFTWANDPQNQGKSLLEWKESHKQEYALLESRDRISSVASYIANGGAPPSRQVELQERGRLFQMPPEEFIAQYKKDGFVSLYDKLGKHGAAEMQNRAERMMSGSGEFHVVFDRQRINDFVPKSIEKDKDKRAAFLGLVSEFESNWKKGNQGKQPTDKDYQDLASFANREYVSVGSWFNSNDKLYLMSEGNRAKAIPKDAFETMKSADPSASDDDVSLFYRNMRAIGATEKEISIAWVLKKKGK